MVAITVAIIIIIVPVGCKFLGLLLIDWGVTSLEHCYLISWPIKSDVHLFITHNIWQDSQCNCFHLDWELSKSRRRPRFSLSWQSKTSMACLGPAWSTKRHWSTWVSQHEFSPTAPLSHRLCTPWMETFEWVSTEECYRWWRHRPWVPSLSKSHPLSWCSLSDWRFASVTLLAFQTLSAPLSSGSVCRTVCGRHSFGRCHPCFDLS